MSTQQDIYAAGFENRPSMLNKDNYIPWSSRINRYARSRPNGKMIVDFIKNGPYVRRMIATPGEPYLPVPVSESFHEQTDEELTENDIKRMDVDDQVIQTILLSLPEDVYATVDSCETTKEIWKRVRQMMKGSDIGEQEKKAKLFNEWENFTSTDGESIESYYHRFMQLMNDLKRNKHFPENIASNLKFLNNLQPEWKRHITIDEVNELRAERLAKSHDLLALMAHSQNSFNFPTTYKDQSSSITHSQQLFQVNNKYNPQPSLYHNFMHPPMTSLEDINDPTEAINAAPILFAKAFQLTAPTNNNQRTSSNPRNRQIAQPVMNMSQDRQIQNAEGNGGNQFGQYAGQVAQNQQGYNAWQNGGIQGTQNAGQNASVQSGGNQNGLVVVPGIANQNGTGNVVVARAEGTGNRNQARCYNCRGLDHIARNCTARPRRRDAAYLQTQLLIAQKEEAWIQLLAKEFDFIAVAGDLDEIEEVNANCILMSNLQHASTSNTQLDKAPVYDTYGSAEVQLNDNCYDNKIFNMFTQEEQYTNLLEPIPEPQLVTQNDNHVISIAPRVFVPQTTKYKEELFLSNVSNMVTVSKTISIPIEDLSDDTTPSVARKFLNERFTELYLTKLPLLVDARVQNFEIQFLQKAAKFVPDFKSLAKEADESLDKQKYLDLEIKRLLKASVRHDIMSIVQNGFVDVPSDLQTELDRTKEKLELYIIKKEKEYTVLWNNWYTKFEECKYDKISYDKAYNDMQQKVERLQAQLRDKLESKIVELEFQVVNYEREISHLKTTYKNLFGSITSNRAHAKLHDLIYENAQLRVRVFENTSESMNNTSGTSVTPHVDKPKLSAVTPHSKKLHASIPSHSVPQPENSMVDLVPNKQYSAGIRTNLITNSQRHIIVKENVSSNTVTVSSTGLVHIARTRRPQPKGNTRNDRVPSASKSSKVKKSVTIEDHRRTLLLSKNQKTMSSECNIIKLAIRNDKSKIICDTCKQCLVTANHDACLPSFVNALNSHVNKLCANVLLSANQKRHRTQVWKPKQVGSKERLACKPRLPRLSLKWSPSRRNFNLKGKLVAHKETKCSNDDKACTSNPQEPMRKQFPNSTMFLGRLSKFVCGTVRFRNDHIAAILGYGDLKWGNLTITRVYFVEGLGHNLFSVGQFCDADLEVAFGGNTCFIRYLDGVDFLKGNHSTNLYTINLYDMASASPICLMARATPTKSWLLYQQLSHLNFDTINDLAKNDLISGLPKFNYAKEHLCPSCELGKSKRASHLPKPVLNSKQQLHMDLCGPMRVASINGKRYVLVIVDDYSRYTWVYFLRTKDETPEVIKNFLKKIYVRLQAHVIIVRTDNETEFKIHVLKEYLDSVGIIHETSVAKTPQQNGVVERRNRTLVEAARTMLIFSHAPLFLWAKPSERDLDILFEPFHNEYLGGRSSEAPRTIPTAPVLQNLQAPTTSMSIQDSALTPTNSSNTPISSHNVDVPSQQHAQQQRNLTPSPTRYAAENVPNAVSEGDLFVNPFATPSTESVVSSTQYVDPSNMHTFY
nr:hypothetical protein [Tanacetum cinerariifolium]